MSSPSNLSPGRKSEYTEPSVNQSPGAKKRGVAFEINKLDDSLEEDGLEKEASGDEINSIKIDLPLAKDRLKLYDDSKSRKKKKRRIDPKMMQEFKQWK